MIVSNSVKQLLALKWVSLLLCLQGSHFNADGHLEPPRGGGGAHLTAVRGLEFDAEQEHKADSTEDGASYVGDPEVPSFSIPAAATAMYGSLTTATLTPPSTTALSTALSGRDLSLLPPERCG